MSKRKNFPSQAAWSTQRSASESVSVEKGDILHAKILEHASHVVMDYCAKELGSAIDNYANVRWCKPAAIFISLIATTATICAGLASVRPMDDHEKLMCPAVNLLLVGPPESNESGEISLFCLNILGKLANVCKKVKVFSDAPHTFAGS